MRNNFDELLETSKRLSELLATIDTYRTVQHENMAEEGHRYAIVGMKVLELLGIDVMGYNHIDQLLMEVVGAVEQNNGGRVKTKNTDSESKEFGQFMYEALARPETKETQ